MVQIFFFQQYLHDTTLIDQHWQLFASVISYHNNLEKSRFYRFGSLPSFRFSFKILDSPSLFNGFRFSTPLMDQPWQRSLSSVNNENNGMLPLIFQHRWCFLFSAIESEVPWGKKGRYFIIVSQCMLGFTLLWCFCRFSQVLDLNFGANMIWCHDTADKHWCWCVPI